jgi:hypothetical protein
MTPIKSSSTAIALLLLAAPAAQAQDTIPGNLLIAGQETGVLYAVPTGLAASLCGIDAARATEAAGGLTGALAGSRLILCAVPQAQIDERRLSPVTLALGAPATAAPAPAAPVAASASTAPAAAEGDAQMMVRISVGGSVVEVTPEQAAEACGIDVATIRADAAALEAGAGDPVSATDTGTAGATAPAANTAQIGSPAAAEEVDPDATTTNDQTAMAAEAPAAGTTAEAPAAEAPPPAADAICEISREAAEAMGLPAPD